MTAGSLPKVLSLYCGAGGLDYGFAQAGFEIAAAIDNDSAAIATYRANIGRHAIKGDVAALATSLAMKPDLVIGGPPCQGFSVIGKMNRDDPRSRHVSRFMDVVEAHMPRAFVMENVKALATNERWQLVRDGLTHRAEALGFQVRALVLNAADYGVPQARERMFLIGMQGVAPRTPQPVISDGAMSVREALSALPQFGVPGNDETVAAKVVPARRPVLRPSPYCGSLLFNGSGRPLDLEGLARTLPASMGGNATPIVDEEELRSRSRPWVLDYHARLLAGGKPLRRAPRRLRRITVQEAAALQSFPPGWVFCGSQVARLRQIGNAVPPKLATRVAESVRAALG